MNLKLKLLIGGKFPTQFEAASALGMSASDLSLLIHRRRKPSDRDLSALKERFGSRTVREIFDESDEKS